MRPLGATLLGGEENVPGSRSCQCFKPQFPLAGSTLWRSTTHLDDKLRVSCRCEFSVVSCVVPSALELAAANAEQRSDLLRCELQPLRASLGCFSERLNHGPIECHVWCPAHRG